MKKSQIKEYTSTVKSFLADYNAKIEEINNWFGGIFDNDEQITEWFDADLGVVSQELNLMEMWNDLVRLADTGAPTFVTYEETLLID